MPHANPSPIDPPSKVLITGANGFIGCHATSMLLKRGYDVIAVVRSQGKADLVQQMHSKTTPECDHLLTTAIIPDITSQEAFTSLFEAHRPAAILHLASPFTYATTNFEEDLLKPAVRGTEAVLQAAAQTPSVHRIVQTNSFACIYDAAKGPRPG